MLIALIALEADGRHRVQQELGEAWMQSISREVGCPSRPSTAAPATGGAWIGRKACKEADGSDASSLLFGVSTLPSWVVRLLAYLVKNPSSFGRLMWANGA